MGWKPVVVTLYLDSCFLVNLGMNLWLLFLVKGFLKLGTSRRRLLAAAAVGGAGSCGTLVAGACMWQAGGIWKRFLGLWMSPWVRLAGWGLGLGWIMVRLAFGRSSRREYGKRLAVLWMGAAFTGGMLAAGYGLAAGPGAVSRGLAMGTGPNVPGTVSRGWFRELLVFGTAVAGITLALAGCWKLVQERLHEKRCLCEALVSEGGKTIRVKALWDTGNQLFEPYTHQPVHVITRTACERLCGRVSGVLFVPFQAVGTRAGMLPAVRVESMDVVREGSAVKHYEHPWLAVSEEALSARGQYEMLLHGEEG
ncbi:MAG: sigma-E processing peptidase SpoIIGA [Lachnospiraceae bacterium]|nr:sigma-E processing peptidase SpoIIGA [Lachnospiraceae bacterium]